MIKVKVDSSFQCALPSAASARCAGRTSRRHGLLGLFLEKVFWTMVCERESLRSIVDWRFFRIWHASDILRRGIFMHKKFRSLGRLLLCLRGNTHARRGSIRCHEAVLTSLRRNSHVSWRRLILTWRWSMVDEM